MRDSQMLLTDLGEEMQKFMAAQYGWLFVQGLMIAQRIPFLMSLSRMMLRHQCMGMAVLSHMGNRLNSISSRLNTVGEGIRVGNMTLAEIRCVPPLRRGTHAAAATYIFGGRLMVNLRCDPATFGVLSDSATPGPVCCPAQTVCGRRLRRLSSHAPAYSS
jgi:hypothetical protein